MHANLKPSVHCNQSAQKQMVYYHLFIKHFIIETKLHSSISKLYVRPHLEFSVPAWCPWSVGDKETIEKVQKRAVSMVSGLTGLSYSEKLIELNLQSLENRRLRYDLIDPNVNQGWYSLLSLLSKKTNLDLLQEGLAYDPASVIIQAF